MLETCRLANISQELNLLVMMLVDHDCSGTDVRLVRQLNKGMRIQPGICSGGTEQQRGCKTGDVNENIVCLQSQDETGRVCPGSPALATDTRLSSCSTAGNVQRKYCIFFFCKVFKVVDKRLMKTNE